MQLKHYPFISKNKLIPQGGVLIEKLTVSQLYRAILDAV
jgi:hypothetical protein